MIWPKENPLGSCTIITGDPNDLVAQIHTRIPVILPEEHHARWLGEVEDGDLRELLMPFPADQMKSWSERNGQQTLQKSAAWVKQASQLSGWSKA
jgi:putative SOS response-associated peptidase YedK